MTYWIAELLTNQLKVSVKGQYVTWPIETGKELVLPHGLYDPESIFAKKKLYSPLAI